MHNHVHQAGTLASNVFTLESDCYSKVMRHHWQLALVGLLFSVSGAGAISTLGCFSPHYQEGLGCSESGGCPDGQSCSGGLCYLASSTLDAAPDSTQLCEPGSQDFGFTGSIESFEIPSCVEHLTIEVFGAQGGGGFGSGSKDAGGKGARMLGVFSVTGGSSLSILVGQRGANASSSLEQAGGSGGGGTFVVNALNERLLIAGGGGGATNSSVILSGGDAPITEAGQDGGGGGFGGIGGSGGVTYLNSLSDYHTGTGGGGFTSDGTGISDGDKTRFGTPNYPGTRFLDGGAGGVAGSLGRNGGFGGGGSAGSTGGGGGGYSGGGGGAPYNENASYGGGGGGSYNGGIGQDNAPGLGLGDGKVLIRW